MASMSNRRSVTFGNQIPSSTLQFEFSSENTPNAEILLPSIRRSGYTLETAIGDLADNPLDAGADTIAIAIDKADDDWVISVADNGIGMDRGVLDQMMRLGSRAEHDLSTDLGAFGLGSTTASLSLGRRQHVITSCTPDEFLSAATDLDETIRAARFVKHLAVATAAEIALFRESFERWDLPTPSSGTVVRITRCDNIGRSSLAPAVRAVREYVGRTYRYFINAGKSFFVNGELVGALDPLERHDEGTTTLFEDAIEYTYPKGHPRAGEVERIGAVLVQLQNWGGIEENKAHGYTLDRSGFYIMRNRREIVDGSTLGLYTRHNDLTRFRGELLFPATMDHDLGVTFLKSNWDIKLSQSLHDKIEEVVRPYIRQARRMYNYSLPSASDDISHEEAAKLIRQRSPFLRKPKTEIERRSSPTATSVVKDLDPDDSGGTRSPVDRAQKALADAASFEVKELGMTAPFFEANLQGRKIVVTYNSQHPFYQRFFVENRENRSITTAVDYLVYSMASAELLASDDDTYRFIERMREDTSFNLRQLLTT